MKATILFCVLVSVYWQAFVAADQQSRGILPEKKYPESCEAANPKKNGVYKIQVNGGEVMQVYCDVTLLGSPWLVIQRRKDINMNFYRNWSAYQQGFGALDTSFFIGLNKLNSLTVAQPQELYVHVEDFDGQTRFAKYAEFAIGNDANQYGLNILGNYSGTAGDALRFQEFMKFSTFDRDNDNSTKNCAVEFTGAWWYSDCHHTNLNGLYLGGEYEEEQYGRGITWKPFRGHYYSLKSVQMMIRPARSLPLK